MLSHEVGGDVLGGSTPAWHWASAERRTAGLRGCLDLGGMLPKPIARRWPGLTRWTAGAAAETPSQERFSRQQLTSRRKPTSKYTTVAYSQEAPLYLSFEKPSGEYDSKHGNQEQAQHCMHRT